MSKKSPSQTEIESLTRDLSLYSLLVEQKNRRFIDFNKGVDILINKAVSALKKMTDV